MSQKPRRILIVDASAEDREARRHALLQDTSIPYDCFEASNGEAALALCRTQMPDCILLDYDLPDLNGMEFMARLRREFSNAPIALIMLAAQINEAVAAEAIKKGAQDYLIKKRADDDLPHAVYAAMNRVAHLSEERTHLIDKLQLQAAELRDSARRKDEFLALLAHELRNPLGPIRNAAMILSLEPVSEYGHEQAREVIERQVAHMGRLIDDLLDVSRISTGQILLRREQIDLAALARVVAADHRPGIEAARLTLALDLLDSPAWVDGDPTRLAQIVGNLLHNACKFNNAGGSISLSLRSTDDSVVITVSDNGIGMDAELLSHAFESFHQADKSLARSRGGLGLGLALSKGLIELHGGRIDAQSEGPGKGARITLTIPMQQSPARAKPVAETARAVPSSWRVLVIEDNIDAAKTLASLLRVFGHNSFVAHSGSEGVQAARDLRPDVILCDIGLPGEMDGYAVASAIRADIEIPSPYIIAITGYGQEDDVQLARDAGFNMHLTKPVDPTRLKNVLAGLQLPEDANSFRKLQRNSWNFASGGHSTS
jgi:signal transduction histidine kinase